MLSQPCAVHKVQGLSLNFAVVSYEIEKQKSFNQGQIYVALSRVTDLSSLFCLENSKTHAIQVNYCASSEYDRL